MFKVEYIVNISVFTSAIKPCRWSGDGKYKTTVTGSKKCPKDNSQVSTGPKTETRLSIWQTELRKRKIHPLKLKATKLSPTWMRTATCGWSHLERGLGVRDWIPSGRWPNLHEGNWRASQNLPVRSFIRSTLVVWVSASKVIIFLWNCVLVCEALGGMEWEKILSSLEGHTSE